MDNSLRGNLLKLVQEFVGSRCVVSDGTRLFHDLEISGDDVSELLNKVNQQFGTTFEGFRFDAYFPNETEGLMYHVARLFGYSSRKKSFAFGHLVKVVEAGRRFEPAEG